MQIRLVPRLPAIFGMIVAVTLLAAPLPAAAAFDGTWTGEGSVSGPDINKGSGAAACKKSTLFVTVSGTSIRGSTLLDGSYYLVDGVIGKDGAVTGFFGDDNLKGKFVGGKFSGTAVSQSGKCKREITLNKQR